MQFDPENPINKLCAQGMQLEGEGKPSEASQIFNQAWEQATTNIEKLTAAHYIARHQNNVYDKLQWDETALQLALNIDNVEIKGIYPSLYLNIAKCFEDIKDYVKALENYQMAHSFISFLPSDGYGDLIRAGINNGLQRTSDLFL